MSKPRPTINITTNTQYLQKEGFAVIWWDQKGAVYYELLKPDQTVGDRYRQQIIKLN